MVTSTKPLILREEVALDSSRIEGGKHSLAPGTLLRVLETCELSDGTMRARVGFRGAPEGRSCWLTQRGRDGRLYLRLAGGGERASEKPNRSSEGGKRGREKLARSSGAGEKGGQKPNRSSWGEEGGRDKPARCSGVGQGCREKSHRSGGEGEGEKVKPSQPCPAGKPDPLAVAREWEGERGRAGGVQTMDKPRQALPASELKQGPAVSQTHSEGEVVWSDGGAGVEGGLCEFQSEESTAETTRARPETRGVEGWEEWEERGREAELRVRRKGEQLGAESLLVEGGAYRAHRWVVDAEVTLLSKEGPEVDSKRVGILYPGASVKLRELARLEDGTTRVWSSEGWITAIDRKGKLNLRVDRGEEGEGGKSRRTSFVSQPDTLDEAGRGEGRRESHGETHREGEKPWAEQVEQGAGEVESENCPDMCELAGGDLVWRGEEEDAGGAEVANGEVGGEGLVNWEEGEAGVAHVRMAAIPDGVEREVGSGVVEHTTGAEQQAGSRSSVRVRPRSRENLLVLPSQSDASMGATGQVRGPPAACRV